MMGTSGAATLGADLDALMASFNGRIKEIGNLMLVRSGGSRVVELKEVDAVLSTGEHQFRVIKSFMKREAETVAKAQVRAEMYSQQTAKLQQICLNLPARLPGNEVPVEPAMPSSTSNSQNSNNSTAIPAKAAAPREKRGKEPPPRWYVSMDELTSLSSYMRGRLTLEKLNIAVDEMATFATGNAKLLTAPRQKLGEEGWNRVLELRDIAIAENVKGKHFFLESDLKGDILKLDHTGKAVLTKLISEGRHLVTRCAQGILYEQLCLEAKMFRRGQPSRHFNIPIELLYSDNLFTEAYIKCLQVFVESIHSADDPFAALAETSLLGPLLET